MPETSSEHTAHLHRLHNHRTRVKAAQAAVDAAVVAATKAGYSRPQGGEAVPIAQPPAGPVGATTSPPAQ